MRQEACQNLAKQLMILKAVIFPSFLPFGRFLLYSVSRDVVNKRITHTKLNLSNFTLTTEAKNLNFREVM